MSNFFIRDEEQARGIIDAYEKCGVCNECWLNTPQGWRCSYLYERACAYLNQHKAEDGATPCK